MRCCGVHGAVNYFSLFTGAGGVCEPADRLRDKRLTACYLFALFLHRAGRTVTLVSTDIEGSTALYEWNPRVAAACNDLHDNLLRASLPEFFGYETGTGEQHETWPHEIKKCFYQTTSKTPVEGITGKP